MIYFASDIHLGAGGRDTARRIERRFDAWLDRVADDAEAIFLLGDLFDFWFEYREVAPRGFVRTLGRLAALTDRGVRVVLLTGNHDMWVRDYLSAECGLEVYTAPQEFLLAGDLRFGHVVPVQKSFRMKKVEGSQGYARGNGSTVEVCAGHGFSLQVFPVRRRPRLRPHGHQAPWRKL